MYAFFLFCLKCWDSEAAAQHVGAKSLLAALLARLLVRLGLPLLARRADDVGAAHAARVGDDAAYRVGLVEAYPAAVAHDGDVEAGERGLPADADAAELVKAGSLLLLLFGLFLECFRLDARHGLKFALAGAA